MPPCFQIVECIEDKCEAREPFDVESCIFDVRVMSRDLDIRVESLCLILCYQRFRFLDVFLTEQELSIEI